MSPNLGSPDTSPDEMECMPPKGYCGLSMRSGAGEGPERLVAGGGAFDHLPTVVSAAFSHGKVPVFLFVIKSYLVGDSWKFRSSVILPLSAQVSMQRGSHLQQLVLWLVFACW